MVLQKQAAVDVVVDKEPADAEPASLAVVHTCCQDFPASTIPLLREAATPDPPLTPPRGEGHPSIPDATTLRKKSQAGASPKAALAITSYHTLRGATAVLGLRAQSCDRH
jgi:hypothetical protein